jgi:hypothetical protein
MVLKDLGYQIDLTQWETYVTGILSILVALGVISNPENGKGFFNAKVPPSQSSNNPPNQIETPNNPTNRMNELHSFPNQVKRQVQNLPDHSNQIVDSSTTQTTEEIVPDRRFTPNEK